MKKFVFLLSCFMIVINVKTYPQFHDINDTDSDTVYKQAETSHFAGWSETDQNSDNYNILNHPDLPFADERNNLFTRKAQEENPNQHLKALESSYPGAGGSIDNRMILDSSSLYYSQQTSPEGQKVWSSVYAYSARLNKTEVINYIRDWTQDKMVKENRYVYAYDANDNQTEWADYTWNSQMDEWVGFRRKVYIYDAVMKTGVLMSYSWDSITKNWSNGWPEVDYAFDERGNLTEKIIYEWFSEKNDRMEDKRDIYKYDTKGNLIADTCYSWDSLTKSWKKDNLFAYIYDSRSNLTGKYIDNWDLNTSKWIHFLRNVYSYDGSSNMKNEIEYDWNSAINTWRGIYCIDYKYDSSRKLTEQIRKSCDLVTCIWSADERYVYSYDDNGNLTEKTRYHWNEIIKNWEETEKLVSSWSYPFINNQSFYVNEKCNNCSFLGSIITGSTYNREKITFHLLSGNTYNLFEIDTVTGDIFLKNPGDLDYDLVSSYILIVEARFQDSATCLKQTAEIVIHVNSINDNAPEINDTIFTIAENSDPGTVVIKSINRIKFYPNPATDFLYLEIPDDSKEGFELELTNLAGQVIFNQSEFTGQIDVTQFQTGIYFVKVRVENNEMIAGKVMISTNH